MKNKINAVVLACSVGLCSADVFAVEEGGLRLSGSGFLTVGLGKMLGGDRATVVDFNCPCFTSDYAQTGVYDGRGGVQWRPDTRLGLQGRAELADSGLSFTAQAVARGANGGQGDVQWAYGSYLLNDSTSIQLGRKRLPMFYYSDTQDVGFALPWTHLPPQLYGWEAVNYNGVNLLHRSTWGQWGATLNVLAGREHLRDSGYWKIYNGQHSRTDVNWDNIVGADLTLVRDWFETRFVYIQSNTVRSNPTGVWNGVTYTPSPDPYLNGKVTRQRIYSAAFNVDYADWLMLSEFLYIARPGAAFEDTAQLVALGNRIAPNWQAMVTLSRYQGKAVTALGGDPLAQEGHVSRSLTVRRDLSPTSAIKVQFDSQKDRGGPRWIPRFGNARLLTLSYDRVF
jgi:hypothetical protein